MAELVNRIESGGIAPIQEDPEIKGFKGFIKAYKSDILGALTVFAVNIIFSLFGLLNLAFGENMIWLGIILYVLFLGAYGVFLFLSGKGTSHIAYNAKRLNSVNLVAGRRVPKYKKRMEYHACKGYLIGLAGSIPLLLLGIISLFLPMSGGAYNGLAVVMRILYSIFFTPFTWFEGVNSIHVAVLMFGTILNVLIYGISYQLYGMKMQFQQEMIEDEMRRRHEDFDKDGSDKIDV